MANQKKKVSLYCINVKIQSEPKPTPMDYYEIITKVFKNDGFVNYISDKAIAFKTQFAGKIEFHKKELPYVYGKLVRFTIIKGSNWYNRGTKDYSDVTIPENMYPNPVEVDYIFIPSIHRFLLIKGVLSVRNVEKFIQESFSEYTKKGQEIVANFQKSKDAIEKVLNSKSLLSLDVDVSYTNDDIGPDAKELIDGMLKEAGIGNINSKIRPDSTGVLDKKSKMIEGLIELSRDNGSVTASIINSNDKKEKIETINHPEITSIEIDDEDQLNNNVVLLFLKKYPRQNVV